MERVSSVAFARHHVQREALGDLFQYALRLLGLLEHLGDLRECGDLDPQFLLQQQGQFVDQVEVAGIGEGDIQCAVLRVHGHEVVAEHQVHGNGAEQLVVDGSFPQVDVLVAVARGQRLRLRRLRRGVLNFLVRVCHSAIFYRMVSANEKIGR